MHETTLQRAKVTAGDLIFAISGTKDNLGTVSILPSSIKEANLNSALVRLDLDTSKITKEFFSYFFDLNIARRQIEFIGKGAAQNNLNNEEISDIKIPLPPIEIQKSLVAEIEAARQNRKQKLAQAEDLLSSIDSYLLSELGLTLPEKSKNKVYAISPKQIEYSRIDPFFYIPSLLKSEAIVKSFKPKVVSLSSLLSSPILNGVDARKYQENGQRYLRVQNIKPFEIILDDVKCVSVTSSKDVSLSSGDVLLTRKGTFGVAAIVSNKNQDCLISSEIMLLRMAKNSECRADYLVAWLNSSMAQKILERHKTGGIMGHLTQDIVSQFPIPIPSDDTQQKIIQEIYHKRQTATKIRQEAELEWETAKTRFENKLLGEET
ncbi:MAG: restriction endonuclease subunit S [Xenococcaceae cyanobacterium MO_207.B15]|nr:restriction endonuclease subunit S [Xenococcaceae cyanobacterium MO_207.B15]